MAKTVAARKQKGRGFQQKCRDRILKAFKHRGVAPDDVKSTAMGQGGEDIQLSPFARQFMPYSIECKKHKGFAIYNVYDQAMEYCGEHQPLVLIEADRRKPLAVMDMEHFFELLERIDNADGK